MESAMTALVAVAGLTFSVAIGLLVEELVFGTMFRLVFAQARKPATRTVRHKGENPCY
ncbi:MAG TPA: hypothetical protein VKT29_16185 [Terriglobales bacterium]|nr:hypothetical protein [Terriglobales bacterium]